MSNLNPDQFRAWHITNDPDFHPDPTHRPNGPTGKQEKTPYLSLTTEPKKWASTDWMAGRTHAVEVEIPAHEQNVSWAHTAYAGMPETRVWGDSLAQARVRRVVPLTDL